MNDLTLQSKTLTIDFDFNYLTRTIYIVLILFSIHHSLYLFPGQYSTLTDVSLSILFNKLLSVEQK
jgi:hypothetical protein